jgi:hypothetical protein
MRAHSALGCEVVAGAVTTRPCPTYGAWDLFFVWFPGLTARANLGRASRRWFFSAKRVMAGASADGDAGSF